MEKVQTPGACYRCGNHSCPWQDPGLLGCLMTECSYFVALPHSPASDSRPEGTRGDERMPDERSEGGL
jgi:hypothetical protein